jgi:aspartyl protease family protein
MSGSGALTWIAAGLIGLATVAPGLERLSDPPARSEAGAAITRAPDGQFYTDASVSGVPVRILVDPGADRVLLTPEDARRIGLHPGAGFAAVTLPSVSVGGIEARDVEAVIAPDLPVSLLGRSYLRHANAEIAGDRLTLD